MELTITADTVITASALLAALGSFFSVALWWAKFTIRDKHQSREMDGIRREQTLICFGVMACLKGLREQGCNGPVTAALDKLEKHLNEAAHEDNL